MKVKSFGCSFIYGNELSDDKTGRTPSKLSWPALVAQHFGAEYQCFACPGSGNLQIYNELCQQIDDQDTIYIIGWTFIDRFDYLDPLTDKWNTLLPNTTSRYSEFYYKNFHSQYRDKLQTLSLIHSSILALKNKKAIITTVDSLVWETDWHSNPGIKILQDQVKDNVVSFNGLGFLDWSRSNNWPVSQLNHPLDYAHKSAADYILKLGINKI